MNESINTVGAPGATGTKKANQNKALIGLSVLTVGALGSGIVLFIVGLVMHSHNDTLAATCNSGLGQLGQAVNSQAASMCSHAAAMADLGIGLVIGGVVVALWGIRGLAAAILGATTSTKSK
jgi:hypothetical protein